MTEPFITAGPQSGTIVICRRTLGLDSRICYPAVSDSRWRQLYFTQWDQSAVWTPLPLNYALEILLLAYVYAELWLWCIFSVMAFSAFAFVHCLDILA